MVASAWTLALALMLIVGLNRPIVISRATAALPLAETSMRYKNWKMYWTMAEPGATGWLMGLAQYNFTLIQNIKRDPFEQAVAQDQKTAMSFGASLGAPMTGFQYDFNIIPLGQQMALMHLETFREFPPLQLAADYNLDQVEAQIRSMKTTSYAGE